MYFCPTGITAILSSKRLCRLALLLVCVAVAAKAAATPVNDAYRYEDSFSDNTGIDINSTGFINLGGAQTAKSISNQLISRCFQLPQAAGGAFTGWSFAEFTVDNLAWVFTNNLHIESCNGNTNYTTLSPPVGTTSVDLAPVVPVTATSIRFRWDLRYWFFGGGRTAAISNWRALGTSTGATLLSVTPSTSSSDSNSDITFTMGLGSNGVTTKNPVLEVDLNAVNGRPDQGPSGIGLATDATVCYDIDGDGAAGVPGTECNRYRPLEFLSASNGTSGEPADTSGLSQPAQVPATGGATDGVIRWVLQDLPDAYSGSISVNLHIPKGYIDGKTIGLSAKLDFGETSVDGLLDNFQVVNATSALVSISSQHAGVVRGWSPFGNLGPGAQNIQDTFYIRNQVSAEGSPSDHENVTLTLQTPSSATCVPTFRRVIASSRNNWPRTVDEPAVGTPLDSNPVSVKLFRVSYINDSTSGRARLYYDIPNDCVDGTRASSRATPGGSNPTITNTVTRNHNVVFNACRSGYNHMHRLQSGLLVENDYRPSPAWSEYYINRGSVRPGEYISTWSPYGDSTYRTQTVELEKSYAVIDIPDAMTFHGYRTRSREDTDSKIYFFKDPTGAAVNPDDALFNNDFNPATEVPATGWHRVRRGWNGPFSNYTGTSADDTDQEAVVGPGARLLVVKTNDNTSFGASDYGLFRTQAVWRVCDGSFGCAQSADNTIVKVTGQTYTYQQIQAPFSRSCNTMNGYSAYVGGFSYPKVYTDAVQDNVQAGNVASIVLTPHNSNHGSQFVDGHWSFDLSSIASSIDLNNVTGEVITAGLNLPKADQNIQGQSCAAEDIVFVAPTVSNPVAYWDIPDRCQIPNGWGYVTSTTSQDNYVAAYQLKLNVPIKTTTLAGTVLDFAGQIRRKDHSATGADNAVNTSRWPASNYEDVVQVTVLENPSAAAIKSAPSGWPINSTFTYSLIFENRGNTPLFGYFMIDELPRTGTNGSEFDPVYGQVYVNVPASDAIIERSIDTQCNSSPQTVAWINEPLISTSRAGYLSETGVLNTDTICVRMRRSDVGAALPPAESINVGIDVTIPDDLFLSGKSLHNKAIVGVSDAFGGTSNVASSESALVSTIVDGSVVLGATKSTTASLAKPDEIGWYLGYNNQSGTDALNVTITDSLAAEMTYQGLMQILPNGVSCKNGNAGDINSDGIDDCALINVNADGTGGTLELIVDLLTPDDGNPLAGSDQGKVGVWTSLDTDNVVQNCVYSIPPAGVTGSACADGQRSRMSFSKTQLVEDGRSGAIPVAYFGESLHYTLTVQNNGSTAQYVRIEDRLPPQLKYTPGTLVINGANASDGLISEGVLSYLSTLSLAPGSQIEIKFSAVVDNVNDGVLISNRATSALCANRTDIDSCLAARESNLVEARIEGSRIEGRVFADNGDGAATAHDGVVEGLELPVSNMTLSLTHVATDQVVGNATTDGNGNFTLYGNLNVGQDYRIGLNYTGNWMPVSHHKGNTLAVESDPSTTELTFSIQSSTTTYTGIRFGLVEFPKLIERQSVNAEAGQSVVLPHTYSVTTQGSLMFDISVAQAAWTELGWQVELYHDIDCNQQHTNTDTTLTASIVVDPDVNPNVCLLYVLKMPDQVSQSVTRDVPLTAWLSLADETATGHDVILDARVVNSVTITVTNTSDLLLNKQVENLSRAETATTANQALPGEVLRYEIEFEVDGTGSITDVFINDSTPAYTVLDQPVSCPASLPDCAVVIPSTASNNSGYSGEIKWKIANDLPAGTMGVVSFDVEVE